MRVEGLGSYVPYKTHGHVLQNPLEKAKDGPLIRALKGDPGSGFRVEGLGSYVPYKTHGHVLQNPLEKAKDGPLIRALKGDPGSGFRVEGLGSYVPYKTHGHVLQNPLEKAKDHIEGLYNYPQSPSPATYCTITSLDRDTARLT